MHISNALSSKSDTVDSVFIKERDPDGKTDKIVADLRTVLMPIINAYKYGKVFTPDECPWIIGFNAVNTAIEREEQETMESRSNLAGGIIGALATIDQEFAIADKRELARSIWKLIRLDDEEFERVFPPQKQKEAEAAEAQAAAAGEEGEF